MDPDSLPLHRHLVVIATDTYDDETWQALPEVRQEVAAVSGWLCDPRLGSRAFTTPLPALAENPTMAQIRHALEDPGQRWTDAHAVFVFVTGHGEIVNRTHRLILRQTESRRIRRTSIRTADIISWLDEHDLDRVFVVIDTCDAGQVAAEVLEQVPSPPPSWVVLPSAIAGEKAVAGALTAAIGAFLDELAADTGAKFGFPGDYLTIEQFLDCVRQRLGRGQTVRPLYGSQTHAEHVCLPNPHPKVEHRVRTDERRQELALPEADLAAHWGPRARGLRENSSGWFFTGKQTLMTTLIAAATGPVGATVVTGGAGTGKSALLARLVTLSDARFRADRAADVESLPWNLVPPEGSVDVAVLASGKTPKQVFDQVAGAFGLTRADTLATGLAQWRDWLARRGAPVTVVIDALDEMVDSPGLIRGVLCELEVRPERRLVRLLIGVRTTRGSGGVLGRTLDLLRPRVIAVDSDEWWVPADLTDYVASVLTARDGSPYRRLAEPALAEVARHIAEHSHRSFLVGGLAARSLAAREHALAPGDPDLTAALSSGVTGVFRSDLHSALPDARDRELAVALLRAVAHSKGRGLPWETVWPAIATGLAGRPVGDDDIAWLLSTRLSGYLTSDWEDGRQVYRPFHELLRDALVSDWPTLLAAS